MNNRGRFQAQGKVLEQSTSWAQVLPLTVTEGHSLLTELENKIPQRDAISRAKGFAKCRQFIDQSYKNGGIKVLEMGKPLIKSFPKGYLERVDLEVHLGIAFV